MGIYQPLYDLINTYLYGGAIVAGSHQDLVAVTLASICTIFVFALPFIVVWRVIRFI